MKLALLVFLSFLSLIVATSFWDRAGQQDLSSRSFVGKFHAQGTRFRVISEDITQYIMSCCEKRSQAIQLLEDYGFKVKVYNNPDPQKLAQSIRESGLDHDEIVYGRRSAGIFRFWRIFTYYQVTLYLKDGEVIGVYATANTDHL